MEQFTYRAPVPEILMQPFKAYVESVPAPSNDSILCSKCSEVFKCSKGLEIHLNKIHFSDPKQYTCEECDKRFKSKYLVKAHFKQVHQRASRILCAKCDRFFSNKFTLCKHNKKFHPPTVNIS